MLIPVNFLLSLLCLLLLIQRREAGTAWRLLLLVMLLHTLNAGLVAMPGARGWRALQPVTAAALPLLCYAALARDCGRTLHRYLMLAVVPGMAAVVHWLPQAIDGLLAVLWLGCAAMMLWQLRAGSDGLLAIALSRSELTARGWRIAAWLLLAIALLDITVARLFAQQAATGAAWLLLGGNLLMSAVLGMLLVLVPAPSGASGRTSLLLTAADGEEGAGQEGGTVADPAPGLTEALPAPVPLPDSRRNREAAAASETETRRILAQLERLMQQGLYRRADLNLLMLARKAGIPARQVSAAINSGCRQSVSHYVNGWRIREACRLLAAGDRSVITVMEACGFQTKSNFNREFRRICGVTPSEWRARASEQAEITP